MELFQVCPVCTSETKGSVSWLRGTAVHITQDCKSCKRVRDWKNQPYIKNMPVLNLITCAAILFSGNKSAKILRVFRLMNLQQITSSTFFRHQQLYLEPIVFHSWQQEQSRRLEQLKLIGGGLVVSGDGRSDSPGHCAKYGTFTFIEQRINKVITIEIVQVRIYNIYIYVKSLNTEGA